MLFSLQAEQTEMVPVVFVWNERECESAVWSDIGDIIIAPVSTVKQNHTYQNQKYLRRSGWPIRIKYSSVLYNKPIYLAILPIHVIICIGSIIPAVIASQHTCVFSGKSYHFYLFWAQTEQNTTINLRFSLSLSLLGLHCERCIKMES